VVERRGGDEREVALNHLSAGSRGSGIFSTWVSPARYIHPILVAKACSRSTVCYSIQPAYREAWLRHARGRLKELVVWSLEAAVTVGVGCRR